MPGELARALAFVALGLALLAYFLLESGRHLIAIIRGDRASASDAGSLPAIAAVWFLAVIVAFSLTFTARGLDFPGGWPAWWFAGAVLVAAGAALRLRALGALGEAYSPAVHVEAGQRIVTGGPYRVVRHPAYTGALVMLTGIGVASANGAALAVCIGLPLAVLLFRIRIEERALFAALGEPYAAYAAGRKRLIPFVW
ncbi:MAG: isoprenylcysteine carboxylmethyltransferase family protein [Dehalococcoidia bacterium]|nr:isoprenylcysteine carboxylmethyltransferase family protein [Dehalococcoidia bacterium]